MKDSFDKRELLKKIPKTDKIIERLPPDTPRSLRLRACRKVLGEIRTSILAGKPMDERDLALPCVVERVRAVLDDSLSPSLRPVINATGVVIHTNLGRSLLSQEAVEQMLAVADNYSNLEYDLSEGGRGSRYSHVQDILCELTGAESALVVNNNAAAVLIMLDTLAKGREVVVSRGELVEIGGSFRIPDIMARSGAILREVGTTNRTHLADYERAMSDDTALIMRVHQSNFAMVGFTSAVPMQELKELGERHGIPVIEDLGSGSLVDLAPCGLMHEPTVQDSLAAGADLVSFSGDKMLGGPQAGIIVGSKELLDRIRENPLNRAVRIDKLTLSALEGTLKLYRSPDKALFSIPTLRMLTMSPGETKTRAGKLLETIRQAVPTSMETGVRDTVSRVGGGAMPLQELGSTGVFLRVSPDMKAKGLPSALEREFRRGEPPLIVRIEEDEILLDVRTVKDGEFPVVAGLIQGALQRLGI